MNYEALELARYDALCAWADAQEAAEECAFPEGDVYYDVDAGMWAIRPAAE